MTEDPWERLRGELFSRGVLDTRLGRALTSRFLLIGLAPLFLFAAIVYWQSFAYVEHVTEERLAFITRDLQNRMTDQLKQVAHDLAAESSRNPLAPRAAARRPARPEEATTDPVLIEALKRGDPVAFGRFSPLDSSPQITVVTPAGRGFAAVDLDPLLLWNAVKSTKDEFDGALLVDAHGRLLLADPAFLVAPRLDIPDAGQAFFGRDRMGELGEVVWRYAPQAAIPNRLRTADLGILVAEKTSRAFWFPAGLLIMFTVLMLVSLSIIVVLSYNETRKVLTEILRLEDGMARAAAGDWRQELKSTRRDELGDLSTGFNLMTERLRLTYENNVRLGREAMVGRLAAIVAHQVNTPLAAIRAKLEALAGKWPEQTEILRLLIGQVDRIGATVASLLGFARLQAGHRDTTVLAEVITYTQALFRESFDRDGIRLNCVLPGQEVAVRVPARDVQEVLVNLLENARTVCTGGPHEVTVAARVTDGQVELTVSDDGPGLAAPPEKLFEPFFTTRLSGSGLGLSICRRICDEAGGSITAANRPGGGACFTVRLPAAG